MKPTKKSIAFVIYNEDRDRVLCVQQPKDDKDLPNAWGLPAGSLKDGESFEEAVLRSAMEKLGVNVRIVGHIGRDSCERKNYNLIMEEYEVNIIKGTPRIPEKVDGITQYQDMGFFKPENLVNAYQRGSLCSRIYLESIGFFN